MTMGGGNARRAAVILFLALVANPGASAGLYVVDVDLPQQSPVHNVVVTYNLPAGVIYKIGSFSASGVISVIDLSFVLVYLGAGISSKMPILLIGVRI